MKRNNYLKVRFGTCFVSCLLILNLLFVSKLYAVESQFGAYPSILKPINIEQSVLNVLASYKNSDLQLTDISKDLLVKSVNLMYLQTNNKTFLAYKDQFEKIKTNNKTENFSKEQLTQLEIFGTVSELSLKGNIVVNKELKKTLIENFRDKQDDYHKTDFLKILLKEASDNTISDRIRASLFIYNTAWGINQSVGMMWLDAFRVPTLQIFKGLMADRKNINSESTNKPLLDAAFIAAASQVYRLTDDMSQPMPFVKTKEYQEDIKIQKQILTKSTIPDKTTSFLLMRKAAEAQLKNLFKGSAGDARDADRSWYRGAFFTGMMAAWKASADDWYLNEAITLSKKNQFKPGPNAMHDANDLNISQVYIELKEAGKESDIEATKIYLDSLISRFNPDKVEWSWCDALYMAPATWAGMSKVTGNDRYLQHMDKLWWQTTNLLFDKKQHLFYRDLTYVKQFDGFQIKERNGKNIFWGRGNGWVMGALPRVIGYMPKDYVNREKYETLFKQICESLIKLQGKDGLWRSSLLDPNSYPMGETSSTTFYCYAFAWGINNHLLDAKKYTPSVKKAWTALCALVNKDSGRLEYVQLPADSPRSAVFKRCNVEYATGAFLLAGSEVVKILE